MSETKKTVFHTLNSISLKGLTKKKVVENKQKGTRYELDYLEWSTAITLANDAFPDQVSYKVREFPTKIFKQILIEEAGNTKKYVIVEDVQPLQYCSDGQTAWVEVEVTVAGCTATETLAIMDSRNQSIKVNEITSTAVNKSIKRCLVKALANMGLGLSLWQKDLEDSYNAAVESVKNTEKANTAIETFKAKIAEGYDRDKLVSFLRQNYGTSNPQTIKDADKLNQLKTDLDNLKAEDFKADKKSK